MDDSETYSKDYFYGDHTHFGELGGYELLVQLNKWRVKKFRKKVLSFANHHKTLLDIGCAFGHFLQLMEKNFDICGVDISKFAVERAKEKLTCPLRVCNIQDGIPFNKKFDVITAMDIIEHLEDPKTALINIHNQLNEEGLFFCQVPTVNNKLSKIIYDLFFSGDETHIFIKSIDEIVDLIESVGFRKLAIYSSLLPIFFKAENITRDLSLVFCVFRKS
ncbi:MAG: methyltransferase domain-containing protein [Candidatus Lokiarchaeota archaeon]|nr:methyltransferase domain-containing protein [Candidatus Lokiarchaeota archaeon]MBD3201686.1 methyltransferase domain-containing protein [Candidatus Lokiarchaeota archaeon]